MITSDCILPSEQNLILSSLVLSKTQWKVNGKSTFIYPNSIYPSVTELIFEGPKCTFS